MPDRLSFRKTFRALENVIGLTQRRHALITSNISNLDTPGYKAKDIDFKTALSISEERDLTDLTVKLSQIIQSLSDTDDEK